MKWTYSKLSEIFEIALPATGILPKQSIPCIRWSTRAKKLTESF